MSVKKLITVSETKRPATISWASIGEVDTDTAREFAIELLRQIDSLAFANIEIAPYEYWTDELPFQEAKLYCFSLNIDGKIGWRFPTLQECDMIRKQADSNLRLLLTEKTGSILRLSRLTISMNMLHVRIRMNILPMDQ